MADLAEVLRGFRTSAELTQEQLAERAGLSAGAIAALETGRRRRPWTSTIDRLAAALDLSAEQRQQLADASRRTPDATGRADALPADLEDLVGREAVTAELADVLTARPDLAMPPIAISGLGGVGKTALAVRVARLTADAYPDGVLYLNLGGQGGSTPPSPLEALGRLLRLLGLPAESVPDDVQAAGARFRSLVAVRRHLILLDDAAGAEQVMPLLPGTGESAVLITSRSRLVGLAAARHVVLDVLSADEALNLLHSSLAPRIADEPEAAREIVRLCGRLPLALRIAGGHLADRPQRSLTELAAALSDEHAKLQVLAGDGNTGVRATIALSIQHLAAGDQSVQRAAARALPLIAWIEGEEFSLRIAMAALDVPLDEAEDALEYLVDANLLETPAVHLYRLHDLVRAVGREMAEPEAEGVLLRVLEQYTALLWRCDEFDPVRRPLAMGWREPGWSRAARDLSRDEAFDLVDAERDGLLRTVRSAARGSVAAQTQVVRLAPGLNAFAINRKRWIEWRDVNLVAVALVDERSDPVGAAMIFADLGLAHNELGDFAAGAAAIEKALHLARRLGDRAFEGRCLVNLAHAREQAGELIAAHEITLEYLDQTRNDDDPIAESWAYLLLGIIAGRQGRADDQRAALERALALYAGPRVSRTQLGMRRLVVGESYREAGRYDLALPVLLEALEHYQSQERWNGAAEALDHLGAVFFGLHRWDDALSQHERALVLAQEHRLWDREASVRARRGRTYQAMGRNEEARQDWEESLRLYTEHGSALADEVRESLDGLPE